MGVAPTSGTWGEPRVVLPMPSPGLSVEGTNGVGVGLWLAGPIAAWTFQMPTNWWLRPWLWPLCEFVCSSPGWGRAGASGALRCREEGSQAGAAPAPCPGLWLHDVLVVVGGLGCLLQDGTQGPLHLCGGSA